MVDRAWVAWVAWVECRDAARAADRRSLRWFHKPRPKSHQDEANEAGRAATAALRRYQAKELGADVRSIYG